MTKTSKASRKGTSKPKKKGSPASSRVVTAPVARSTIEHSQPARITNPRNGAVRVARREFCATVTNGSNTTFTLDANTSASPGWDFNPAVSSMFPWLSQIANAYERFKFHKLSFELVASQATSTPGRVYLAIDYDWDDEVPANKAQMMGNMSAQEAPVWSNLRIVADPRSLMRDMPYKFVNTAGRVVYSEPRTAYAGFLIIGFDTTQTDCRWDLWVDYDVELEVPVVENLGATLSTPIGDEPSSPSYVTTVTPWHQASGTGSWASYDMAFPVWTANRFTGNLIREVFSGIADVPTLATPSFLTLGGLGQPWGAALDIARLGLRHWLTFEGYLKAPGTTPSTIITNGTKANAVVYDALGAVLGTLLSATGTPTAGLNCVDNACKAKPAELTTTDKAARALLSFSLEAVKTAFPTARYLMPFFMVGTGASLHGSGAKVGFDYRVW